MTASVATALVAGCDAAWTVAAMPELPEVETVRRGVAPALTGRCIVAVDVPAPHRHLVALDDAVGLRCRHVGRRGKVIVCDLVPPEADLDLPGADPSRRELVVHLGMTGRLTVGDSADRHVRARITLDDGTVVTFVDPRRFGRLLVCAPGQYPTLPMLSAIGPDPDDCTPEAFVAALGRTHRPLKACLLDQRLIAGVGNIYADESLHRVGLDPRTPAAAVTAAQATDLLMTVRELLAAAVAAGGTTVRDYRTAAGGVGAFQQHLEVYGRAGLPCRRCRTPLARDVIAGRGTVWCPDCQPDRPA